MSTYESAKSTSFPRAIRPAASASVNAGQDKILEYYARQSAITDPGPYSDRFGDVPRDVAEAARVVQGLLMHPAAAGLYGEPPEADGAAWGYRTMAETIERILTIDGSSLVVPRSPRQRLRGNCRNFAVLFISLLRHRGIPARRRVGFARYLPGHHSYTHEIAEYWRPEQNRWVLVDPQIDEPTLAAQHAFFSSIGQAGRAFYDPLDIRLSEQFVTGGEAWQLCRSQRADPDEFRSGPWQGLPEIACAALQDLDGLNKLELLSTDSGHDPSRDLTPEDIALLDHVAELTASPEEHFAALRELFNTSTYGKGVRRVLRRHQMRRGPSTGCRR